MPPYKVKLKVNSQSHVMVDGVPSRETGWIDGTHAFEASLTGVAAGTPAQGDNPAATASIKVTCRVTHTEEEGVPVPEVTITLE